MDNIWARGGLAFGKKTRVYFGSHICAKPPACSRRATIDSDVGGHWKFDRPHHVTAPRTQVKCSADEFGP
eukprot:6997893-Pyramimonas_sp.AAC.1